MVIEMEWKTFGKRGRLGSVKQEILRKFRLTHNPNCDVSACASEQEDKKLENFNLRAYLESNRRMHEIETQQAWAITLSGHERWKAGRPT
jgi:hypothetical protein